MFLSQHSVLMHLMKKVLIITDLVHATPRIPRVAKYLPEFGWQPIILTTPSYIGHNLGINVEKLVKQNRVIVVPYRNYLNHFLDITKKIFGFNSQKSNRRQADKQFGIGSPKTSMIRFLLRIVKEISYYPDQFRDWRKSAINVCNNLMLRENIDALISSSSPVTSHIIAKEFKQQHKIPWVADLRDLWSQNHNYPYSSLRNVIDRNLELRTLSQADTLVTVSEPWTKKLTLLHKDKKVYTITNGFYPEESVNSPPNLTSKFTITYTGQIYEERQDPSKLFAALRDLIKENLINPLEIDVRFYGNEVEWLTKETEKYGLTKIVKQYGSVSRKVAIERQRESQLLLLLNWEDTSEKGVCPLKVFEYLAAQRPIIATGGFGHDVIARLLDETNAGFYAQRDAIKEILKEAYSEYKLKGEVGYRARTETINRYSYQEKAKMFAQILDDSLKTRNHT